MVLILILCLAISILSISEIPVSRITSLGKFKAKVEIFGYQNSPSLLNDNFVEIKSEHSKFSRDYVFYTVFKPKKFSVATDNSLAFDKLKNIKTKESDNKLKFKIGKLVVFSIAKKRSQKDLNSVQFPSSFLSSKDLIEFIARHNSEIKLEITGLDVEVNLFLDENFEDKYFTDDQNSRLSIFAEDNTSRFSRKEKITNFYFFGSKKTKTHARIVKNPEDGNYHIKFQLPTNYQKFLHMEYTESNPKLFESVYEMQSTSVGCHEISDLIEEKLSPIEVEINFEQKETGLEIPKKYFWHTGKDQYFYFFSKKAEFNTSLLKRTKLIELIQNNYKSLDLNKKLVFIFQKALKVTFETVKAGMTEKFWKDFLNMNNKKRFEYLKIMREYGSLKSDERKELFLNLEIKVNFSISEFLNFLYSGKKLDLKNYDIVYLPNDVHKDDYYDIGCLEAIRDGYEFTFDYSEEGKKELIFRKIKFPKDLKFYRKRDLTPEEQTPMENIFHETKFFLANITTNNSRED